MTPGPVPVPMPILREFGLPVIHHRTPEFVEILSRVSQNLKKVFETDQPVFMHASTGSGAMESAIANLLSPHDEVIVVVSGKFGERWAEMAEAYGVRVQRLNVPWGQSLRVERVADLLKKHPECKVVYTQACETSTGALHPIRELAQLTRHMPTLLAVDGITALGAMRLPMDEWGVDVLIGGSQKAFMLPTGLSFISLSERAWKTAETARCPRFYFDLRRERASLKNGETYFSSSVSHVRALDRALQHFLQHGLNYLHARVAALSRATLGAARELQLASAAEMPAPSLTALRLPDDIDGQKVRADMEKEFHVTVMGGQDQWKGKIIRIGHMGAISNDDLFATIDALVGAINLQNLIITEDQLKKALAVAREHLASQDAIVW